MSLVVDVIAVLLLIGALAGGIARGLLASAGALLGVVAAGAAAWWLLPLLSGVVPWSQWRGLIVLAAGIALLFAGGTLGGAIGMRLRRGVDRLRLGIVDRVLGGALSVVVAALAISLVGQSVVVTGTPVLAPAVASSTVLRTIDDLTPSPLSQALAQLRQGVLSDGLPQFGALLDGAATAPAAAPIDLADPALNAAAQSVARISGTAYACSETSTGSGFVIAPDRVVTNAHVVAGVTNPIVELPGRAAVEGRIVYDDPHNDIAVIATDGLDAAAIPLGATLTAGAAAVVQGYPYGGPFTSGNASVTSVGEARVPDIYGSGSDVRDIYALDAVVRPGNSGGPLLDASGRAVGIVFARSDSDPNVGYAMTTAELTSVVAQAESMQQTVSSGACIR
ncbi:MULTISPECIES: MarP family serine protease [Microbacterium]|jgi:S1-C subfamily serine protease|uniref:Serine protease n=3 Tax=Microbacterium ginsengisoli TaxID=400772 RepID=A0A0F0LQJ0_9MICO|nr:MULTISPECIES: MarP family serine protease [Microbacterium]MCK9920211.1 MarP family serine protease [Microbacteriaceae bacterium K1510]KJL34954.1 Serine protease [Microbacterium ginsengisoli]KJL34961.1 Serine protease [Microbacterium ginsengisoli]KQR90899.1 colicin V production protein [Microbacterium sp. Leaf347]KQS00093.1 colicin V production protein [Microbacterium sp. Leaf351]